MKIVVAIKQVAQLHDGFEIVNGRSVDPDYLDFELNEWDSYSLAAAAELALRLAGSEIIAVTVGGEDADPALREAVSLGAHRAVRIDVPSAPEFDVLQVARLVAGFAAGEDADLVLCGVQSADAGTGATPAAVAGYLNWARVTPVLGIEPVDGRLSVRRELTGGTVEHLELYPPAVLAVQSGSFEVPYPTMKAKMAAKRAAIDVVQPADLLEGEAELEAVRGSVALALAPKTNGVSAVALDGPAVDVASAIRRIIEEELA